MTWPYIHMISELEYQHGYSILSKYFSSTRGVFIKNRGINFNLNWSAWKPKWQSTFEHIRKASQPD